MMHIKHARKFDLKFKGILPRVFIFYIKLYYIFLYSTSNKVIIPFYGPGITSEFICFQCTLLLLPENVRKPYDFLMLSRGRERMFWEQMD